MAVPNRPTSGAPIETAWGDQVHDVAVLGRGVVVNGGSVNAGAGVKAPLDAVVLGSAAMVDLVSNELVAPIAGIYEVNVTTTGLGLASPGIYRANLYRSAGAVYASIGGAAPGAGGSGIRVTFAGIVDCAAGERLYVEASTPIAGSGTASLGVDRVSFRLIAAALG